MRIVGGLYKGRALSEFDGEKIRPTSDKARESLFNILQFKIYDSEFLDLFCGTGAMGIEALSRGAKSVTFNDISRESISLTRKNLEKLKITDGYSVHTRDALDFLRTTDGAFDIIFIDPPYKSEERNEILKLSAEKLKNDGVIIFESESESDCAPEGLIITDQRKYGRARLTFYKREK